MAHRQCGVVPLFSALSDLVLFLAGQMTELSEIKCPALLHTEQTRPPAPAVAPSLAQLLLLLLLPRSPPLAPPGGFPPDFLRQCASVLPARPFPLEMNVCSLSGFLLRRCYLESVDS